MKVGRLMTSFTMWNPLLLNFKAILEINNTLSVVLSNIPEFEDVLVNVKTKLPLKNLLFAHSRFSTLFVSEKIVFVRCIIEFDDIPV